LASEKEVKSNKRKGVGVNNGIEKRATSDKGEKDGRNGINFNRKGEKKLIPR